MSTPRQPHPSDDHLRRPDLCEERGPSEEPESSEEPGASDEPDPSEAPALSAEPESSDPTDAEPELSDATDPTAAGLENATDGVAEDAAAGVAEDATPGSGESSTTGPAEHSVAGPTEEDATAAEPSEPQTSEARKGVLVLAGTPIGTVADASPRLGAELAAADVIAAEDTRRLRRLADRLGIVLQARVVSYFEGNEAKRTPQLVRHLRDGDRVVLVTDAGMPAVSDPGYRLVTAAIDAGIPVTAVPGPSAVLTALALSGLPVDRFCFEGFPPRKPGERARRLRELASEPRTMVFFEAPHRLAESLEAMADVFGAERPAAVCRELTKVYEEVRRDRLGALVEWARGGVRGEVTVVVAGRPAPSSADVDEAELARLVAERVEAGTSRKTAIAEVAAELGLPKRTVYNAAVARRED